MDKKMKKKCPKLIKRLLRVQCHGGCMILTGKYCVISLFFSFFIYSERNLLSNCIFKLKLYPNSYYDKYITKLVQR